MLCVQVVKQVKCSSTMHMIKLMEPDYLRILHRCFSCNCVIMLRNCIKVYVYHRILVSVDICTMFLLYGRARSLFRAYWVTCGSLPTTVSGGDSDQEWRSESEHER